MSDLPTPPDFTASPAPRRTATAGAYLGYWSAWAAIVLVGTAVVLAQPDTCDAPGQCPPFTLTIDHTAAYGVLVFFTLLLGALPGALLAKALARRSPMPPAFDGMVAALVMLAVTVAAWYLFIRFVWSQFW